MEPNIAVLITLARSGDKRALGELLQRYEKYLVLLARVQLGRKVQGKLDPVDLAQETFLDAHRQIHNFRGSSEAEFLSWLRTLFAGQIALMLRRYIGTKGRDVALERELAMQVENSSRILEDGIAASQSTPSQAASRREQSVLLANALDRLKDDYREVIILRHLEGRSFADVAERMGRSCDSVQKLWLRALTCLRQMLGGQA